jgi:hypothetical protein
VSLELVLLLLPQPIATSAMVAVTAIADVRGSVSLLELVIASPRVVLHWWALHRSVDPWPGLEPDRGLVVSWSGGSTWSKRRSRHPHGGTGRGEDLGSPVGPVLLTATSSPPPSRPIVAGALAQVDRGADVPVARISPVGGRRRRRRMQRSFSGRTVNGSVAPAAAGPGRR